MKTTAVITAYYPDTARFKENVMAIAPQVDNIVIYNNGGLPSLGTLFPKKVLDNIIVLGSGVNDRLSIAFNTAFQKALDLKSNYVLLLDQDSIATKSLVTTLSHSFDNPQVALAGPRIIDRSIASDSETLPNSSTTPQLVDRLISSGSLISLEAWKSVGGYNEQLNIDWVDFEFCANLRLHGFQIIQLPQISLLHELGHRAPSIMLPQFNNGSIHIKQFYSTNHSSSRRIDKARSWALVLKEYRDTPVFQDEKLYILKTLIRDLLVEPRKIELLKSYKLGYSLGRREYRTS